MRSRDVVTADYDVLVLGSFARDLVRALAAAGLRAVALDDPLHALPGWGASFPAKPMPDVLPWLVTPGFAVACFGPSGPLRYTAPALVLPIGSRERLVPFPGCTLPGVGGIGMALEANARVLLVGPSPWREAAHARIGAAALDAPTACHVLRAQSRGDGLRVWLEDEAGQTTIVEADRLMVSDGWLPATDVFRMLRTAMDFDAAADAWPPRRDVKGRCTVPFLYAMGPEPEALATTIAADLARQEWPTLVAPPANSQVAVDNRVLALPDDSAICPCEGVTAGDARASMRGGLREINQLKSATRCGMGDCGGRLCEDVASRLIAATLGTNRSAVGYWSGRAPLVPVPLAALIGEYEYADIPIPAAAPL